MYQYCDTQVLKACSHLVECGVFHIPADADAGGKDLERRKQANGKLRVQIQVLSTYESAYGLSGR